MNSPMALKQSGGQLERRMPSSAHITHRFSAMTVPCEVQLYDSLNANHIAEMIEHNTRRLEKKYNFYSNDSWLSTELNHRDADRVQLDDESIGIFQTIRNLTIGTDGVFDPTVGSVKCLLKENSHLTHEQAYHLAKPMMGQSVWNIEGNELVLAHAGTRFDLGGVIKEFAIDQAISIVESLGVSSALINFGGDIRVLGSKPDNIPFNVAVVNPSNPTEAFFSLPLVNAALTTSAHYERKTEFSDIQTSHILSEKGTHTKVLSVTVIAPTALEAGAISTALTINPLLSIPKEAGVIFIDDELKIHQDTEFLTQ